MQALMAMMAMTMIMVAPVSGSRPVYTPSPTRAAPAVPFLNADLGLTSGLAVGLKTDDDSECVPWLPCKVLPLPFGQAD